MKCNVEKPCAAASSSIDSSNSPLSVQTTGSGVIPVSASVLTNGGNSAGGSVLYFSIQNC